MRESQSFWTRMGSCDHDQKTEEIQGVVFRVREIVRVQESPEKWPMLEENVQDSEEGFKKEVIGCAKCYLIKEDDC